MNLTATDRKTLIRLASSMEKGSDERKAILAGLEKTANLETGFRQEYERRQESADQALGHLVKAQRILKDLPINSRPLDAVVKELRRRLR